MSILFFGHLAYASLELSKLANPKSQVNELKILWNPFFSSELERRLKAKDKVAESLYRLEFMTFRAARIRDVNRVLSAIKADINQRPFIYQKWSELIAYQFEVNASAADRLWSIESALMLNGWNEANRLQLAARCLEQPAVLLEIQPSVCKTLLSDIPLNSKVGKEARLMGVNRNFLTRRLGELNEVYSFSIEAAPKK